MRPRFIFPTFFFFLSFPCLAPCPLSSTPLALHRTHPPIHPLPKESRHTFPLEVLYLSSAFWKRKKKNKSGPEGGKGRGRVPPGLQDALCVLVIVLHIEGVGWSSKIILILYLLVYVCAQSLASFSFFFICFCDTMIRFFDF